MATARQPIGSISAYLGLIDSYNHIDNLDRRGGVLRTISGNNLPADDGDHGSGGTHRRADINFDPSGNVAALRFRSDGVAFEFDEIAASSVRYAIADEVALDTMPSPVPEPTSCAMLIGGVGVTGGEIRCARRRTNARPAHAAIA